MSASLELLSCGACGAAVAVDDEPAVQCAHCGANVAIPDKHVQALRATREDEVARASAGELLIALGKGPAFGWAALAVVAMVLLPTAMVWLLSGSAALALCKLELTLYVATPALIPGAALLFWAMVAAGTSSHFCQALNASPPQKGKGAMRCRRCDAPLSTPTQGHVARCVYCDSDNLLRDVQPSVLQKRLRSTLRTLDDAFRLMRVRRALWGLGLVGGGLLVAGLIVLVSFAQR